MEEESWKSNHGGIMGGAITSMEEESWQRVPGGGSMDEESRKRKLGEGLIGFVKHLEGIWEASGKHLGGIWAASGKPLRSLWEGSGKPLEVSGKHLGGWGGSGASWSKK